MNEHKKQKTGAFSLHGLPPNPVAISAERLAELLAMENNHAALAVDNENLDNENAELEKENERLMAFINNPHAVHAHYLRIGNGWEIWTSERVRGMERELERLNATVEQPGMNPARGTNLT